MEQQPVYPRWRGEHNVESGALNHYCGLSPLARGTLRQDVGTLRDLRFIPADAGNTTPDIFATVFTPVYPRWRGEHLTASKRVARRDGLSPLARGTH